MKEITQIVYGLVVEALPASTFKIKLDNSEEIIRAYLSGKMRMNRIKVICGDRVAVEMTPYDIGKGRISRRL